MRRYIFIMVFALLVAMLAACTSDPPSDTRGCIAEEGQTADEVYNLNDGCLNGSIISEEGGGHGEAVEGTNQPENAEDANQAQDSQSEAAPTEAAPEGQ